MLWPSDSADQVLLQWTTTVNRKNSTLTCKLIYDETHHYIRIVDAATNHVLDTIDGYDVLGASISIDMKDSKASEPRAETTTSSSTTNAAPSMDSVPNDTQAHATLTIHVYPRKPPKSSSVVTSLYRTCRTTLSSKTDDSPSPTPTYVRPTSYEKYGTRYAHHRTMIVQPVEDLFHVREIVKAIQGIAKTHNPSNNLATTTVPSTICPPAIDDVNKPRHYVIICNPTSGPNKNAEQIAHERVIPMLQQANIETTICVTTHPGHAVELCHLQSEDESNKESTTPSGTGGPATHPALQRLQSDITYYNGIVVMGGDGTMHEVIQGIFSRSDAQQVLSTIPIGIIGCGTANGLATSLSYTSHSYYKDTTSSQYDFTYKGILDDIFAIAKGYTIEADLSSYSILESGAEIDAVASTDPTSMIKKYTSFLTFTYGLIAEVDIESERIHWMGHARFDVWAVVRVLFLRKYPIKLSYTTEPSSSDNTLSITDPVPSSWTTIEDKMSLLWASQVSHVSIRSNKGDC